MIASHRIGPAPFISVDECGDGELLILITVSAVTSGTGLRILRSLGSISKLSLGMRGDMVRVMIILVISNFLILQMTWAALWITTARKRPIY